MNTPPAPVLRPVQRKLLALYDAWGDAIEAGDLREMDRVVKRIEALRRAHSVAMGTRMILAGVLR